MLGPYLDLHCTFFRKLNQLTSVGLTKRSSLQVKKYDTGILCRQKYAPKFTRAVALGQILISYFHTLDTDERTPTEFPLCHHIIKRLPDSLTIREQRTLMEQISLCKNYMIIAVSCLHYPDATISMTFQLLTIFEQQMRIIIYLRSLISPIAVCC